MRQLSGKDASFLYLDSPNGDTHGTIVFIYDPSSAPAQPVRFKDILAHIESRLSISRIFRQRLVHVPMELDYPYWVDDKAFDIEYHVRHVALPKPSDWRQFCILASRLHTPPLNLQRPLWEMTVVEGLDNVDWLPRGSFALLIKAHHCALDGHTAAELTMGLHDLSADGSKRVEVPAVPYCPEATPSVLELLANAVVSNARSPFKLAGPATRALPKLATTLRKFYSRALGAPGSNPVTRFNLKRSPHRVFTARRFALDDVKRVRAAVPGATINDAVLSICAGAVRQYLDAKGELPASTLRVIAPINTRAEGEYGQAGNNISFFFPDVRTDIDKPIARLEAVYESTRHAKEVAAGIGAREMTDISKHMPAALTLLTTKLLTATSWGAEAAPLFHFAVSNVPGPTVPLYLCGARMQCWSVVAPLTPGMGLLFAVTSYLDRLFIAPTADRQAVPDPDFLEQCIDRSFAAHLVAANALLRKHPELLAQSAKSRKGRRAHPGLAAMAKLSGANAAGKTTGRGPKTGVAAAKGRKQARKGVPAKGGRRRPAIVRTRTRKATGKRRRAA